MGNEKKKDPVCGMEVEKGSNCAEYKGKTYCFCAPVCRDEFLSNPQEYVKERK